MKIKFKLIYLEYFEYSIYLKIQLMFTLTPYKLYSYEFHIFNIDFNHILKLLLYFIILSTLNNILFENIRFQLY